MSPFDIVVIVIILGSGLLGFKRGFVKELIETVGAVVAAIMAYRYHSDLAGLLNVSLDSTWWSRLAVFFGFFLGVMALIAITGFVARKFIRSISLGMYDHLAGFVLGGAKGGIAVAALSVGLLWIGPIGEEVLSDSKYARANLMVFHMLSGVLPDPLREKYVRTVGAVGKFTGTIGGKPIQIPVTLSDSGSSSPKTLTGTVVEPNSTTDERVIEYIVGGKAFRICIFSPARPNVATDSSIIGLGEQVVFELVYLPERNTVLASKLTRLGNRDLSTEGK